MSAGVLFPPVGFHFMVRFDFSNPGGHKEFTAKDIGSPNDYRFQEVSGLTASVELEDIMEGGENTVTYSLPKAVKQDKLVLKRGLLIGSEVAEWIQDCLENFKFTTCNVQVVLLNDVHLPLSAWDFEGVYPVGWNLSAFNAMENAFVVETIELRYLRYRASKINSPLSSLGL